MPLSLDSSLPWHSPCISKGLQRVTLGVFSAIFAVSTEWTLHERSPSNKPVNPEHNEKNRSNHKTIQIGGSKRRPRRNRHRGNDGQRGQRFWPAKGPYRNLSRQRIHG